MIPPASVERGRFGSFTEEQGNDDSTGVGKRGVGNQERVHRSDSTDVGRPGVGNHRVNQANSDSTGVGWFHRGRLVPPVPVGSTSVSTRGRDSWNEPGG